MLSPVGEPLYLTPYIQNHETSTARKLARVYDPLPGVSNRILNQYAGFITVNETTNSNMFFWFFPSTVSAINF